MLGMTAGKRRRGWQRMRWLKSSIDSTDMNLSKLWKMVEKEMATHSSILTWEIPQTEVPGRLESIGLQRLGQDCVTEQ